MKKAAQRFVRNWRVKLACLAAAMVIWLFIKHNIARPAPVRTAPLPTMPAD